MSDNTKVLVRNAREQDLPAVVVIDAEAFSPHGAAAAPETFQRRLTVFPNGFFVLVADNEIAAYGCSEKWLAERQPGTGENPIVKHEPDGRILCITAMAVKKKYRGRGYGRLVLDRLIEIAHLEGCKRVIVETADAQGFFLKRGFQTVQDRAERGSSPDVLSLDLKPISRNA